LECIAPFGGPVVPDDQDREVGRRAAAGHLVPQGRVALRVVAAERGEFGERQHHRIVKAAQPLHVEHDNLVQRRTARPAGQDLVELLLILDEHDPGAGIVDEIFDLRRRVGRIDARGYAACTQNAHVGIDPFRHRVGDDRGDVAGTETGRMQAVGDVL
jgi:hypothetical protein